MVNAMRIYKGLWDLPDLDKSNRIRWYRRWPERDKIQWLFVFWSAVPFSWFHKLHWVAIRQNHYRLEQIRSYAYPRACSIPLALPANCELSIALDHHRSTRIESNRVSVLAYRNQNRGIGGEANSIILQSLPDKNSGNGNTFAHRCPRGNVFPCL